MVSVGTNSARRIACGFGMSVALLLAAGCGHHKNAAPLPPVATAPSRYPPASNPETTTGNPSPPPPTTGTGRIPITPVPVGGVSVDDKDFVLTHRPLFSQEGSATWYRAPYEGRKAANGQVFRDDALTAAHRTLPMGSLIVVTNLATRQSSAMRISDRGPFVPDKILDLSPASAKSIGLYRIGTTRVRIDVYQTPKPVDTGGRWCVQIGPLTSERNANKLKDKLLDKYPGSRVIEFPGEKSFWVRIRPGGDDREQAEDMARRIQPDEGTAYLTRLD